MPETIQQESASANDHAAKICTFAHLQILALRLISSHPVMTCCSQLCGLQQIRGRCTNPGSKAPLLFAVFLGGHFSVRAISCSGRLPSRIERSTHALPQLTCCAAARVLPCPSCFGACSSQSCIATPATRCRQHCRSLSLSLPSGVARKSMQTSRTLAKGRKAPGTSCRTCGTSWVWEKLSSQHPIGTEAVQPVQDTMEQT